MHDCRTAEGYEQPGRRRRSRVRLPGRTPAVILGWNKGFDCTARAGSKLDLGAASRFPRCGRETIRVGMDSCQRRSCGCGFRAAEGVIA
jgi:hypothetical protein